MSKRVLAPTWGRLPAMVLVATCAMAGSVLAQPKVKAPAPPPTEKAEKTTDKSAPATANAKSTKGSTKDFNFNGMDLNGRMRTPQLLYFLERANEELERASLEKRSFIPHMVRSVEEEKL